MFSRLKVWLTSDPRPARILKHAFVAAVLVALGSLALPNRYRSEVLVLPRTGQSGSSLAAMAAMVGFPGMGKSEDGAQYGEIVKSRWNAERLLDATYTFTYQPWYFAKVQSRQETLASFLKVREPKDRESALRTVQGWLKTQRDPKSGVVRIEAEVPSPELAQQVLDRAVAGLEEALKAQGWTEAAAKADYARERLQEARLQEETARQALEAYAKAHVNFAQSPDAGVRSKGERLVADLALRRQVVATLTLGYEQAELDARNTVPVLSRLAPAYRPLVKSAPSRARLVILGALLAAAATAGWLYRRWIAERLFVPEEPSSTARS